MRRGLACVVPTRALRLCTAHELEVLVAGESEVDLDYLKQHSKYDGFSGPDDVIVKRFWRVFSSFSNTDMAQYVRFAWGRSRLPPRGAKWTHPHTLTRSKDRDDRLPIAHTCFFSIELPAYATDERMKQALLTAIHYGVGGILNS